MDADTDKTDRPAAKSDSASKNEVSVSPEVGAKDRKSADERFWRKMARYAAVVPFAEDALAAYYCVRAPETPPRVKSALLAALAYFILPTDVVPDVLPFFGFSDDAAVVAFVLAVAGIRQHLKPEHRQQARRKLDAFEASRTERAEARNESGETDAPSRRASILKGIRAVWRRGGSGSGDDDRS